MRDTNHRPTIEQIKQDQEEHLRKELNMAGQKKAIFGIGETVCNYTSWIGDKVHNAKPETIGFLAVTAGVFLTPAAGIAVAGCALAAKHAAVGDGVESLQKKAEEFKQAKERETLHIREAIKHSAEITALPDEDVKSLPQVSQRFKFTPALKTDPSLAEVEVIEDYVKEVNIPSSPSLPAVSSATHTDNPAPIVRVLSDFSQNKKLPKPATNKITPPITPNNAVKPHDQPVANSDAACAQLKAPVNIEQKDKPTEQPASTLLVAEPAKPVSPRISSQPKDIISVHKEPEEQSSPLTPQVEEGSGFAQADHSPTSQAIDISVNESKPTVAALPVEPVINERLTEAVKDTPAVDEKVEDPSAASSAIKEVISQGPSASHAETVSKNKKNRKKGRGV